MAEALRNRPHALREQSPNFHARPVIVVVALKSTLNLCFADRYGWHRDELYYAVAGHHLQGGYVEFPPVTALLAALSHALFGYSLFGLRSFAILAGAVTAVIASLIARELGGGRRAQVVATVLVSFSPLLIATNGLFQPVSFDQLTTLLFLWLVLRLLLGRGSWIAIGAAAGLGLETKYTIAVVLVMAVIGLAAFRRDLCDPRGLALSFAVAVVVWAPNLLWEARHDWISVHWFLNPPSSASDESRPLFIGNVLLLTHVLAIPVAVAGVRFLWRSHRTRPLALVVAGALVVFLALGGKSYYALPVVMFALACGAVCFDRWATPARARGFAIAFGAILLAMLPVGLPVLPVRTAESLHIFDARTDYQDEIGWPGLVAQVRTAARGADVVIARNYGEAGALEVLGGDRGLPPIASPHVTFRFWRPVARGRRALLVGYRADAIARICTSSRVVGRIRMPVDNEERGRSLTTCELRAPLSRIWATIVGQSAI